MTGCVEWRCSAPGELVHFRTDTHSVGNMSFNRWTELQLMTFLKNWQFASQEAAPEMPLWSFTTLQTFPHQLNSLFPLSSLVWASRTNTTSGSGVSAPIPAYFCFVLPLAAWKNLTRQRALQRTDIARQTRWACRDPTPEKKTKNSSSEHLPCVVLQ